MEIFQTWNPLFILEDNFKCTLNVLTCSYWEDLLRKPHSRTGQYYVGARLTNLMQPQNYDLCCGQDYSGPRSKTRHQDDSLKQQSWWCILLLRFRNIWYMVYGIFCIDTLWEITFTAIGKFDMNNKIDFPHYILQGNNLNIF